VPRRIPPAERRLRQRLAVNVSRLRRQRGLTIQDASEHVGVHWRLWQKVEAGDTNATIQTLIRVAEALGVDPRDLLA
jgi:transcriptional regulator with XRE-family HTH domain